MNLRFLKNSILYVALGLVSLTSCNNSDDSADNLRDKLNNLQSRLMNNPERLDVEKGDSMIYLYKKYAVMYPNDSMSVEYYFRAAEIQMGLNKNEDCIKSLTFIQDNYPDSKVIPMLLQFKAFVYDDKLQDYEKARACMDELINDYPESELIPNAKAYREMIGKNPEEIFSKLDSTTAKPN